MKETLPQLILLGILAWVANTIWQGFREGKHPERLYEHCMTCGIDAPPKAQPKGHGLIELVLWCAFILPGLLYSIWRRTNTKRICSRCGAATLVPPDSPAANDHRRRLGTK